MSGRRRLVGVTALVAALLVTALAWWWLQRGSTGTVDRPAASAPADSSTPATSSSVPPPASSSAPPPASSPVPSPSSSTGVPAQLLGQDMETVPTTDRVVALTFDAGSNSAGLASILQTLAREEVAATFFVTGDWATGDSAGLRAITAAGHRLGNHSMTHPHFPELSASAIRDELIDTQEVLAAAGADPRPLFRFPFGDRDDATIGAVNDLGYLPVRWTVDTLGWQGTTEGRSAASVTERTMAPLRPGAIVLMHVGAHPQDGSTLDADALPELIDRLRSAGYGFVTLDALLSP